MIAMNNYRYLGGNPVVTIPCVGMSIERIIVTTIIMTRLTPGWNSALQSVLRKEGLFFQEMTI